MLASSTFSGTRSSTSCGIADTVLCRGTLGLSGVSADRGEHIGERGGGAGVVVSRTIITNVSVYKAIALEAHQEMHDRLNASRRPKDDGSPGWVITFDPHQTSFKQAMIAIVFTGIWLEALLHLQLVRKHGRDAYGDYDFKSYADKLAALGCNDSTILDSARRFQESRRELVHEKAHFDGGQMKAAQDEADNANALLLAVEAAFSQ